MKKRHSAFGNAAHYNDKAYNWRLDGRPRAHKRSGWRSQVGWFS